MAGHRLTEILDSIQDASKKQSVYFSNSHLSQFKVQRKPEHQPWSSSQYKKQNYTTDEKTDSQYNQVNKINILTNKQKQLPFLPLIEQKYSDQLLTSHDTKQSQTQEFNKASTSLKNTKNDGFKDVRFTCPPIFMPPLTKFGFISSCMLDVTKKDQYNSMNASRNFLRHSKKVGKTAYSSKGMVDALLKKLKESLQNCPETGTTSDILKRLQCFNNIFNDLIINSPVFGTALHIIKIEYDNYISYLLDIYEKEGQVLQGEMQEMSSQHTNQNEQLSEAEIKVEKLECEMLDLFLEAKSLQKEIKAETERITADQESEVSLYDESVEDVSEMKPKLELYDDVETLRIAILEKLDELQTKKTDMRNNYIPISVCLQLEQCIKDTDMELHKWIKQNEYFKTSSAEMEGYLKEAIIEADTSERDVRRIWRKIYSRKHLGNQVDNEYHTDCNEDDDDDDESKWNWYIS
ncbi:uncharacterized protein LOC106879060 [Octopus bimaculoides]|uniref:Translin-associated factor X-interacting protein 1 N-terminal domain-containing protein n=1 Tax=Octopus bimaculoides TaxID=37653 RepID=A0A0L8G566_OCTBM|nr:uncharacterized protein LOC106879060 [Octopus bimaculoides]|eukprot:XP_014783973.1 PREDICTED: uncharacterized protein LOC106879060 [Octopus bimaculoides]